MEVATQSDAGEDGFDVHELKSWGGMPDNMPTTGGYVRRLPRWANWADSAGMHPDDIERRIENILEWLSETPRGQLVADAVRARTSPAIGRARARVEDECKSFDDAWRAAYTHAEAVIAEDGPPTPAALARAVALAVPALPAEHIADAAVQALHHALKGRLKEGAYAEAETAANEARGASPEIVRPLSRKAKRARERDARQGRVSAYLRARSKPAVVVPAVAPTPTAPAPTPTGPREIAFDLESEPGLLGDWARWYYASAIRPITAFAPISALSIAAGLFGRRWATPTGAGLNVYFVALAETGQGKEALLKAPRLVLSAAGLGFLVGSGDFTSDSAIEVALRARPNFIAPIDEVGEFIGCAQHKQAAPHSRTIRKALLELHGRSEIGSVWTGKQKADVEFDKASSPVYCPTLTILGCATPTGFFDSLTESNMQDGFMNRLIVVRAGRPGGPNLDPARLIVPQKIKDDTLAAYNAGQGKVGNLQPAAARVATSEVNLKPVPWAGDDARAAFMVIFNWEISANDGGRGGITARAASHTLKIATLRALCRNPASPAVMADDIAWGWGFVRNSIAEIERGARENMSGSDHEALRKAIERAVVKAGAVGITASDLMRAAGVSKATPAQRNAAIDDLKAMGRITLVLANPPGGGRPSARYFAQGLGD